MIQSFIFFFYFLILNLNFFFFGGGGGRNDNLEFRGRAVLGIQNSRDGEM